MNKKRLTAIFMDLYKARQKFDSVLLPKNEADIINRIGRSGELLGAAKVVSYLLGNISETDWQLFLNGSK